MSAPPTWSPDEYPWVEVATNGAFNRNQIVPATWEPPPNARDTFRSLYRFPDAFRDYVAGNDGSVEGYAGEMLAERLVLDFDSEADRSRALADLQRTIKRCAALGIPRNAFDAWYSGNKGYGLALSAALFGWFAPAVDVPERTKRLALVIAPDCPTLDTRLYQRLRLLREPNTLHGASGRFKVRLTPHEVMTLDDAALTELARVPRDLPTVPLDEWSPIPELVERWQQTEIEPFVSGQTVDVGSHSLTEGQVEQLVSIFERSWERGQKHNVCLGVVGWLGSRGVPRDQVGAMVSVLSADDQKPRDRENVVRTTFARLDAGQPVAGYSILKEHLPSADLDALDAILPQRQTTVSHSMNGRHEPGGEDSGTVDNVHRSPAPEPFALTDVGNAQRLVSQHGADLRYCHSSKRWRIWDGQRWRLDGTGEVMRRAKETARSVHAEAASAPDVDEQKKLNRHAIRSQAKDRLTAMIALAQSEPGIAITPDDLDRDPWLLACRNGVIDLRTGKLCPADRSDLITMLAPVNYDPDAACPVFARFLDRIMTGNADLIAFLRRSFGYALTGIISERVIFFLHGAGRNGKSTLLETMRAVLGDYAKTAQTEMLLATRHTGIPNDVAALKSARLVTASEANEGRRLDEAKVKALTGGDTIAARFLYGEWFTFLPQFKIMVATNDRPEIRGNDPAIWDRLRLIPFDVRIPEAEQDQRLREKLIAEAPGILAWAVQGCLNWQRDGLGWPDAVKRATEGYRTEMDRIGAFLGDCCDHGDGLTVTSQALYTAYRTWCETNGEAANTLTQNAFSRRLTARGFADHRRKDARYWLRVAVKDGHHQAVFETDDG